MSKNFTKIAFTESVKKVQTEFGSRSSYARMEKMGDKYILSGAEKRFIQARDGFYISTVGENGWPYVQFRGGPKGFLKVIDDTTLGMADFRGNKQYISVGNINSNKKAALFLMDYPNQTRLKIWTESEIVNPKEHPDLIEKLTLPDYDAYVERLIIFKVQAFDWNCQQHITPKYTAEEIKNGIMI